MDKGDLARSIRGYLEELCVKLPHRAVGTPENMRATAFFRTTAESLGLKTEAQEFACIDWTESPARLAAGDDEFTVRASPFSLPFSGEGELAAVSAMDRRVFLNRQGSSVEHIVFRSLHPNRAR